MISRETKRVFAVTLGVVCFAVLVSGAGAALADDNNNGGSGIGLVVTVPSVTPTPTPTSTATPIPAPTPSPTSSPSSSPSTSTTAVTPPQPTPSPTSGELETLAVDGGTTIGGALYVGGLTTKYFPSLDPTAGIVRAKFVIRNVAADPIDSSVRFTLSNPFGGALSTTDRIYVLRLKPGESRVVTTDLADPGQWGSVTASFTLTPTSLVEGEVLPELTRDTVVLFAPWVVIVLAIAGAAAYVIVRVVRAGAARATEAYG